jgi:ABC-type uncharacterized transport system ATPase subunit
LKVENLKVLNSQRHLSINDVSFEVKGGEILGIAGVQGNGQTELVRALTGLLTPLSGIIKILNKDVSRSNPRQITELGSAHIPEDRQKDGLVLASRVADNLVLNTYFHFPFAKGIIIQEPAILKNAKELIKKFDIRTPGANIHNRIIEKRDQGCAVLLLSTELDEIMQLSDRIAVIFCGKILTIVDTNKVTKEEVGLLMAGVTTKIGKKIRKKELKREIIT